MKMISGFLCVTDLHFCFIWSLADIIIIDVHLYFLNLYLFCVILNFDKGRKVTSYDLTVDLLNGFLKFLYTSLCLFVL
jgi:hypothetical protein